MKQTYELINDMEKFYVYHLTKNTDAHFARAHIGVNVKFMPAQKKRSPEFMSPDSPRPAALVMTEQCRCFVYPA